MAHSTTEEDIFEEVLPAQHARPEAKASRFKNLLKEPFLHFLVLGAAIFFVGDYIKKTHENERYQLKVGKEELYRLASLWEKQYGTVPTATELKSLEENYIREEILYREGIEMGLDKDDEVIRRRIAQKLEFLQQDLAIVKDPTEEQLAAFYETNKARYTAPEKVSFTHVYFSADNGGDEAARHRAQQVLARLAGGKVNRAPELGDRFAYLYDYAGLSKENIVHQFGESAFSEKILSLPEKSWQGPFLSGYGWHLVYLTSKATAEILPLNEVKDKVKTEYLLQAREEKNKATFEKVAQKYTILKDELLHEKAN